MRGTVLRRLAGLCLRTGGYFRSSHLLGLRLLLLGCSSIVHIGSRTSDIPATQVGIQIGAGAHGSVQCRHGAIRGGFFNCAIDLSKQGTVIEINREIDSDK